MKEYIERAAALDVVKRTSRDYVAKTVLTMCYYKACMIILRRKL